MEGVLLVDWQKINKMSAVFYVGGFTKHYFDAEIYCESLARESRLISIGDVR